MGIRSLLFSGLCGPLKSRLEIEADPLIEAVGEATFGRSASTILSGAGSQKKNFRPKPYEARPSEGAAATAPRRPGPTYERPRLALT